MKVETIYNPGDTVWTMINDKCVQTKTKTHYFNDYEYRTDLESNPSVKIEDYFGWELEAKEYMGNFLSGKIPCKRKEPDLFKSKEELIASL